ncbi:MAG: hypothetical protein P9M04_02910 [Candidatus Orphnella occulta]|nr:hypothetical protein [Candidatus Orphnella occulta]
MIRNLIILLYVTILLTGCSTTGPQRPIQAKGSGDLIEEKDDIVMLDSGLKYQLYLVDKSTSRTDDNRVIARAKFLNKTKDTLRVQLQTIFKNEGGSMTDETNWEFVLIPSNGYHYYESKSLNSKAEKYTIRCRYAK